MAKDLIVLEPEKTADRCVIWLHGLGADGHDFVDIVPALALPQQTHTRFIFPHAPIRPITINGNMAMRAWYDIYELSNLDREDKAGLINTQQLINTLLDQQNSDGIASNRIILAGFSQGGASALYTGLRYPQPLAGILSLSGYLPLASSLSVETHNSNHQTPIFMAHGQFDEVLPIKLGKQSYDYLQQNGYSVEWHDYPMQHQVCPPEIAAISQWLQKQLTG